MKPCVTTHETLLAMTCLIVEELSDAVEPCQYSPDARSTEVIRLEDVREDSVVPTMATLDLVSKDPKISKN